MRMTGELLPVVKETGRITKAYNRVARSVNKVYSNTKWGRGSTGKEVAMKILKNALDIASREEKVEDTTVLGTISSWLTKADDKVRKYTDGIEKETGTLADDIRNGLNDKTKMQAIFDKLWKIRALAAVRSFTLQNNLFNSLTRNSNNEDIGKFYDMFRQSKMLIDRTVQTIKNVTYDTLMKMYDFEKMDKGLRRAVKKVLLDTDYKAIGTLDDVKRILTNDEEFDIEIAKAEVGLKSETVGAAQALGVMIVNNEANTFNGFSNASQIARVIEKIVAPEMVNRIDKLASLYALKSVSEVDRKLALKAMNENEKGVTGRINLER
jgi:hypothetical protein